MNKESNRNTFVFVVSAMAILLLYQFFVLDPQAKKAAAQKQAQQLAQKQAKAAGIALGPDGKPQPLQLPREQAKAQSPRVAIDTPALIGSLALKGGRIDDLYLRKYPETLAKGSPPVELLRPEGAQYAYFADFGWAGANVSGLPGPQTMWTVKSGDRLAPGHPVTLGYDNGQGLSFTRTVSVDDQAMFTIADQVTNGTTTPVTLAPYASVQRQGVPATLGKISIVHEGGIGALGDEKEPDKQLLKQFKYPKWKKDGSSKPFVSHGGWLGLTDKYWMAALIPDQAATITGQYRITPTAGVDVYDADFIAQAKAVAPGVTLETSTRLFAGAKTVPLLKQYETDLKIPRFEDAVDWGMFNFFTKPIFLVLEFFYKHVGNFGVAILLLTVCVKLLFFPLANKSYESITKMKKLQPQIDALKVKLKDDPAKQQQEMMALYGKEKINPMMGCLPMLIQIPVFYSLYKVLSVTIEMRHAPFFGFIQDLSARDPSSIWTLFGLIPWVPAAAPLVGGLLDGTLHVGLLGICYGVTMWLTTAMNPPAPDPTQQRIMQLMPLIFTFTLSQVAVGLMIYWTWNNLLSILQQYVIMRRFKVDNPIDKLIGKLTGKPSAATP